MQPIQSHKETIDMFNDDAFTTDRDLQNWWASSTFLEIDESTSTLLCRFIYAQSLVRCMRWYLQPQAEQQHRRLTYRRVGREV